MAKYAYHRSDANAEALYDVLEACGWSIARIGRPVDAIGGFLGRSVLIEVKTPKGPLKPSQRRFLQGFRGAWAILRSEADCLALTDCVLLGDPVVASLHELGPEPKKRPRRALRAIGAA